MGHIALQIHPDDNVWVALKKIAAGEPVRLGAEVVTVLNTVPAKHKFVTRSVGKGEPVVMYGVVVGTATEPLARGALLTTQNVHHAAAPYAFRNATYNWRAPDVERWASSSFLGYHRSDGRVGTANYWLILPLVFCENRNVLALREAFDEALGYSTRSKWRSLVEGMTEAYRRGADPADVDPSKSPVSSLPARVNRPFPNVDGIRYLTHQTGCGEQRSDSEALARLLAGYVTHPNVAGATVLSLGCQNTQATLLQEAIRTVAPDHDRPVYVLEQQAEGSETRLLTEAVRKTFLGFVEANKIERQPAPLSELVLGVECGGSDGFSGISANPAIGHAADLLVALGGSVILSEFPELCGVEQNLVDRSVSETVARRFIELQQAYAGRAERDGSSLDMNPSPGNIRDGLLTDAIKSAGAALKGGSAPVADVLDYTEPLRRRGLNLLCTPGNDVESTTALTGSGANVIAFSTGLGTPTGNPVAPVIKISSNSDLAHRMPDIIDLDTGTVITGEESIQSAGERILERIVAVASGQVLPAAVRLRQDDFIPWKRGISL